MEVGASGKIGPALQAPTAFPGALVRATAHPRIQDPPAEAQALGRDFEQLVVVEILDELIQTHLAWRGEPVVDYFEGSALVDTG